MSSIANPHRISEWSYHDDDKERKPEVHQQSLGGEAMKLQYDERAAAAYIQLADEIGAGGVANTYPCDPDTVGGMINLDFDSDGRLLGIEILGASKLLPHELLDGP